MENLWMVAGLGNPGNRYSDTRHNVGFDVVDELARRWRLESFQSKFKAQCGLVSAAQTGSAPCLLLKPQTFMNLSGDSIAEAASFYKLPTERLLVVADDMDTPEGALRLRLSGGAGGHNGLRSIIGLLGESFPRLRMGVGRSSELPGDVYVLSKIPPDRRGDYAVLARKGADAVERVLQEGVARAMNTVNRKESD